MIGSKSSERPGPGVAAKARAGRFDGAWIFGLFSAIEILPRGNGLCCFDEPRPKYRRLWDLARAHAGMGRRGAERTGAAVRGQTAVTILYNSLGMG
jgi:hypothetical protein